MVFLSPPSGGLSEWLGKRHGELGATGKVDTHSDLGTMSVCAVSADTQKAESSRHNQNVIGRSRKELQDGLFTDLEERGKASLDDSVSCHGRQPLSPDNCCFPF